MRFYERPLQGPCKSSSVNRQRFPILWPGSLPARNCVAYQPSFTPRRSAASANGHRQRHITSNHPPIQAPQNPLTHKSRQITLTGKTPGQQITEQHTPITHPAITFPPLLNRGEREHNPGKTRRRQSNDRSETHSRFIHPSSQGNKPPVTLPSESDNPSVGTTGTTGITTGHRVMPMAQLEQKWHNQLCQTPTHGTTPRPANMPAVPDMPTHRHTRHSRPTFLAKPRCRFGLLSVLE